MSRFKSPIFPFFSQFTKCWKLSWPEQPSAWQFTEPLTLSRIRFPEIIVSWTWAPRIWFSERFSSFKDISPLPGVNLVQSIKDGLFCLKTLILFLNSSSPIIFLFSDGDLHKITCVIEFSICKSVKLHETFSFQILLTWTFLSIFQTRRFAIKWLHGSYHFTFLLFNSSSFFRSSTSSFSFQYLLYSPAVIKYGGSQYKKSSFLNFIFIRNSL